MDKGHSGGSTCVLCNAPPVSSKAPTDARDEAFLATMQQSPNRMPVWARRRLDEIKEELAILESDAVNAPRGLIDALKDERKTILAATGCTQ